MKNRKIRRVYDGFHPREGIPLNNYGNLIVMPGMIDAHVHINEPGRREWEGFDSATRAAALGGVTTLIEMPLNAHPVTTTVEALRQKQHAARDKLHVNCGFYGGIVPGNAAHIEPLIRAGVFGIKGFLIHSGLDEFPKIEKKHLTEIAPLLAEHGVPLLLHCELSHAPTFHPENVRSYREYLQSRPAEWELAAVELAVQIQEKYGLKVHIVHLSGASALKTIAERKARTDLLSVETCPHYLYFQAETIPDGEPVYKCAPPIREKNNNDRLWEALRAHQIDFIASDHSPAPPELKQLSRGDLFRAWGGIAGLQFSLPAVWSRCAAMGLRPDVLIPLFTENPARFLNLHRSKGKLEAGFDADITVWDENEEFEVTEGLVAHRHKITPYLGCRLKGKVLHTFVGGRQVVADGEITELNAGRLLVRN